MISCNMESKNRYLGVIIFKKNTAWLMKKKDRHLHHQSQIDLVYFLLSDYILIVVLNLVYLPCSIYIIVFNQPIWSFWQKNHTNTQQGWRYGSKVCSGSP